MSYTLHHGDCLDVLPSLEAESVDTCITDPPYGLNFMGRDWDHGVPGVRFWQEVYRVLKPGAMLLAFGGTRTHHRLMVAIEDAGFEIRDCMMWLYGSGFPKSHDISKAIDSAAGAEREVVGKRFFAYPDSARPGTKANINAEGSYSGGWKGNCENGHRPVTAPATDAAQQWDGYGTALKPAWEPIIVAMKPCAGTFAENAIEHGVAGLWIDGGRIGTTKDVPASVSQEKPNASVYGKYGVETGNENGHNPNVGRWPANVILDEESAAMLDEQSGERPRCTTDPSNRTPSNNGYGGGWGGNQIDKPREYETLSGASRFFYCAKASRSERREGLGDDDNHHPTVKPLDLLRYLCKLTKTPGGGVVLDPFMGSGSTGCAAVLEGRDFIGIELEAEYMEIAERRIEHHASKPRQLELL